MPSSLQRREKRRKVWSCALLIGCCAVLVFFLRVQNVVKFAGGKPVVFRALVSYVYFETNSQDLCEVSNKRQNLAFFIQEAVLTSPRNVEFAFSFPAKFPSAQSLSASLGIPIRSSVGHFFVRLLAGQLPNVHIIHIQTPSAPDLCHHRSALIRLKSNFDYYVILNDGVRGPFFTEGLRKVSSDTQ